MKTPKKNKSPDTSTNIDSTMKPNTHPAEKILQDVVDEIENSSKSTKSSTSPIINKFDPSEVFYDSQSGAYIVNVGTHYRRYTRKSPVKSGIKRYLDSLDNTQDLDEIMNTIEIDQAIDWAGSFAGYTRGTIQIRGKRLLVMDEANMVDAKNGECPLHLSIIEQAFTNEDAKSVFISWVRDAVRAIRKHHHHPAPMLVLAGQRNAGKSLIAHIVQEALGGRASNPMSNWRGKTLWNDELLGSELLLIDDSEASTDPRARKALGAHFKENIYGLNVKVQTRCKTAVDMRPVWRVMICCNETPENLSVIPPLEEGIEDKIILLRVSAIKTPMPAQSVDQKKAFSEALKEELPAFLSYIESFETPEHLKDSRDGVVAWKDDHLLNSICEISPEYQLDSLLAICLDCNLFAIPSGESKFMKAADVQSVLQDRGSPTLSQARELLRYAPNCGRYLSSLIKSESRYVTASKKLDGIEHYKICRP